MQFSTLAVALFAGAVMADQYTVYKYETSTITSCAATVTNCPARSTVTSVTSYPVVATSAPHNNGTAPAKPTYPAGPVAPQQPTYPAAPQQPTYPAGPQKPATTYAPAPPKAPVETPQYSTVLITTCIPTVITSSVLITKTPVPTTYAPAPPAYSTGKPVAPGNTTSPTYPSKPQFTGAASAVRGSVVVAAAAGFAAFFL